MAERSKGISRLSLRHLSLIAAIEDTGSLKQASDKIGMSQPRATKALQEAEEMTGHLLFHRSNRGLKPTVAWIWHCGMQKTCWHRCAAWSASFVVFQPGPGCGCGLGRSWGRCHM